MMAVFPQSQARVGVAMAHLSRLLAYAGGIILVAMAMVTVASVIGRWINTGPFSAIAGDYELIEAGCAIAIFAFLPWCHLNKGHVTVDLLVDQFPIVVQRVLTLIGDILIAFIAVIIVWRFYLGWAEKFPYFSQAWRDRLSMGYKPFFPETTYELEIPVWIPMGAALIGAGVFCLVSLYVVWRSLNEVTS
ncbi:TRAP transporter small permease [Algirhabdus cladophorae]|uniref:TRAP transporter small permease n=1 Tax=Algirhabdus cladophorae TaxID=3377108 RepID=UPI003B846119